MGRTDKPVTLTATEYGGDFGLAQKEPHELTPSEIHGVAIRAGMMDSNGQVDPVTSIAIK